MATYIIPDRTKQWLRSAGDQAESLLEQVTSKNATLANELAIEYKEENTMNENSNNDSLTEEIVDAATEKHEVEATVEVEEEIEETETTDVVAEDVAVETEEAEDVVIEDVEKSSNAISGEAVIEMFKDAAEQVAALMESVEKLTARVEAMESKKEKAPSFGIQSGLGGVTFSGLILEATKASKETTTTDDDLIPNIEELKDSSPYETETEEVDGSNASLFVW